MILRQAAISKPLHDGTMFVDLRDTLARAGGRLLVSVLREMRAGKVSIPSCPA